MLLSRKPFPRVPAVDAEALQIQHYLKEVLGLQLHWTAWSGKLKLPLHLTEAFDFKTTEILGQSVITVFDHGGKWSAAALEKQLGMIAAQAQKPVLFVPKDLTAHARARLIEHRIAFVQAGRQLYLPPMGIDLREHYRTAQQVPKTVLASTQAVLLYALQHPQQELLRPKDLAAKLGYTPMTMTRAFNELAALKLAHSEHVGRERKLRFAASGRELWLLAKPWLSTPVAKKVWVSDALNIPEKHAYAAGLTALAQLTDLAPPPVPIRAVPPTGWNWPGLTGTGKDIHKQPVEGALEVQIWAYPPQLFSKGPLVDRCSLYLSLKDDPDERVSLALDELERAMW